jgi:hypothetical protein
VEESVLLNLDNELSPSELAYFESGGDASAVLAEHGRNPAAGSEPDGLPELTDAERRYFETKGDVTEQLRREHGHGTPEQPAADFKFRPEVQAFIDRTIAAHQGERVNHARTQARLDLLREAIAPPPQPAPEPAPRLDPESDIFAYTRNTGERLDRLEQQITVGQRELAEEGAYRTSLDAAIRQEPSFYQAYQHLLHSRAAELMADRYPQATPDQLLRAPVPPDIHQMIQEEERHLYREAFAGNRDPATDIVRLAQMRGWQSPQQIAMARAAQAETERRRAAAEAEARAKAEDDAWSARAAFAQRKQYWDQETERRYLSDHRAHEHKRWFYDHTPGPPPPLPADFR